MSLLKDMKYTTREIINRALKLTDFNDDFFIGNRELTHLLNDNWFEAYSILVNKEDKTFLKSSIMVDEEMFPSDFFKLLAVKDDKGNLLNKAQDYDIINNRIFLKNRKSATVEYYPEPRPLVLKDAEKKPLNYNGIVTKWDDGYVLDGSVIDDNGNSLLTLSGVNTYLGNGYIRSNALYGYNGETYQDVKLIEGNTITYDEVNINTTVQNILAVITNKAHSFFFILDKSGNLYTQKGKLIATISPKTFYCRDDGFYYVQNGRMFRALGEVIESFPAGIYTINGILDEDDAVFSVGENYYSKGYGFDSLLEIPSQLFWSYFAYSIAESICNVVQRDASAIAAKKEEFKSLFLESLQNDNNSVYQIKDVEGVRIW